MLSSEVRDPEASDFIRRDGLHDESVLELNSPILLRSYGETMRYVRGEFLDIEGQESYLQRLLELIDDSKQQVIPKDASDFQVPTGLAARNFLAAGAPIEAVRENHLGIFRIGRENGLFHCSPWPAGWRLNFQLSVPKW